jgi:hypothetical protein
VQDVTKSVQVDSANKTERVGAGVTCGVVDHETQAFGLAVTGCDSRTGVAGLTLGGGNRIPRTPCGPTIDHLIGVEVLLVHLLLLHVIRPVLSGSKTISESDIEDV